MMRTNGRLLLFSVLLIVAGHRAPVGAQETRTMKPGAVALEKDAWYFDGLTVRRDGPDGMVGAVRIESKDGPPREAVFKYRRVK